MCGVWRVACQPRRRVNPGGVSTPVKGFSQVRILLNREIVEHGVVCQSLQLVRIIMINNLHFPEFQYNIP